MNDAAKTKMRISRLLHSGHCLADVASCQHRNIRADINGLWKVFAQAFGRGFKKILFVSGHEPANMEISFRENVGKISIFKYFFSGSFKGLL